MIWFISDLHLGHGNIIKYCHRPFKDVEEMDKILINNWNAKIKPTDTIFYLGDFCLSKSSEAPKGHTSEYYREILNGNIIFIKGNHDRNKKQTKSIIHAITINHGGKIIFLTHNPKNAKKEFKLNFCGHLHGKFGKFVRLGEKSIIVDLSVENWEYRPININDILSALSKWRKIDEK